ncbi:dipeptidase [Spirochaetota bacterium]
MKDIPVFDMHADLLMDLVRRRENGEPCSLAANHLPRLSAGGIRGAVIVDCRMAGESAGQEHLEAFIRAARAEFLDTESRGIAKCILSGQDIQKALGEGRIALVSAYEGLKATGGNLSWINRLYSEAFLRVAVLTHNDDNEYGGGALGSGQGLSQLGMDALELMNKLGILVDMAHASPKTRQDILRESEKPVMLSHTSSAAIYNTGRNLSNKELRQIADHGGLVGAMTSPAAIAAPGDRQNQSLARYMEHLVNMINVAGTEHVGLGLHFCEYLYSREEYPPIQKLEDASKTGAILDALSKAGFSKNDIYKIAWGNFVRVFMESCP